MSRGTATVIQVLSGDTLVLMGYSRVGIPPERQVTLASIVAPTVSFKTKQVEGPDEPFGWEAREYIRQLLIGEIVNFNIEYTDKKKEYASITFQGDDIGLKLVQAGLAKVRNSSPPNCAKNIDELQAAQEIAKQQKKKIWTQEKTELQKSIRNIQWIAKEREPTTLFVNQHKLELIEGIVEFIFDASSYRIFFTKQSTYASVLLSGILVDTFRRSDRQKPLASSEVQAEPYAMEAKHFCDVRLLNRCINVRIEGADSFGNILGTLIHPKGNISILLLQHGFAKINDKTVSLTSNKAEYYKAQKEAQDAKLCKWKEIKCSENQQKETEYTARVLEVLSGDCLIVFPNHPEQITTLPEKLVERRIYLASIRCSRMGTRYRHDEPWAFEAKEFVRKKLIGKKVKVVNEYVRDILPPATGVANKTNAVDFSGTMEFVSITFDNGKYNLNEILVQQGLAKVVTSRNPLDQAANYVDLVEKESEAASKKKGLHGHPAPLERFNDLVGADCTKQAKSFTESLKRIEKLDGVIEHVFNAKRFKIRIPSEKLAIAVALCSIRTPTESKEQELKKLSQKALIFSRYHYMQRNVIVSILSCNLRGTYIGVVWHGKECLNVQLVANGLAQITNPNSIPTVISKSLRDAEEEAKQQKLGLWAPELEYIKNDLKRTDKKNELLNEKYGTVVLSFAYNLNDFYIQLHSSIKELDTLQNQITAYINDLNTNSKEKQFSRTSLPRTEQLVLAKFSDDQKWYRGYVESVDAKTVKCRILFIDYGNRSTVDIIEDICPCPNFAKQQSPYARHCGLSGIKLAPDVEYEAIEMFDSLCNCDLTCYIDTYNSSLKKYYVRLYQEAHQEINIAETLISQGLALYNRHAITIMKDNLIEAQKKAKAERLNVWKYGDVDVESDEEESF